MSLADELLLKGERANTATIPGLLFESVILAKIINGANNTEQLENL